MSTTMVRTVDDLTPAWLTDMLRSNGVLDDVTSVATVEVAPFGSAESMMSSLHRVTLSFDGDTDAPSTLVVKLASPSEAQRFVAGLFKFYEREIRFYNEIAPQVTITVPRCYRADFDPEDQSFVLVLEELEGKRQVDQIEGMSYDDALTAVIELADLHAPFWGKNLDAEAETFLRFDTPMLHAVLPDHMAGDWEKVRSKLVDELPTEVVEMYDNRRENTGKILRGMNGSDTLCHGDYRADNLLFNADGSVIALDYQLGAVAHGMTDVAYLISQSVEEHVTATRGDDLIRAYLGRLASHGIELDFDAAMDPYRAGLVFYLSIPVGLLTFEHVPERADRLARTMLRRASAEVLRTGAHLQFT